MTTWADVVAALPALALPTMLDSREVAPVRGERQRSVRADSQETKPGPARSMRWP
jgi:hypothetical protein